MKRLIHSLLLGLATIGMVFTGCAADDGGSSSPATVTGIEIDSVVKGSKEITVSGNGTRRTPYSVELTNGTKADVYFNVVYSDGSKKDVDEVSGYYVYGTSSDKSYVNWDNSTEKLQAKKITAEDDPVTITFTLYKEKESGDVSVASIMLNVAVVEASEDDDVTLTSIAFNSTVANSVKVGSALPLAVTATYSYGGTKDVTNSTKFESSKTEYATISGSTLNPVAVGKTTVTATYTENGDTEKATIIIDVIDLDDDKVIDSVAITGEAEVLETGTDKLTLTATYTSATKGTSTADVTSQATWSSAKPEIATVSEGVVTGKKEGSTTITATYEYLGAERKATFDVTVKRIGDVTVTSVTFTTKDSTLYVGETLDLVATATLSNGDTPNVTLFRSSDDTIAAIDGSRLTAIAEGEVTVTATYPLNGSSETDTIKVTVKKIDDTKVLDSITLSLDKNSIDYNGTATLTAKATFVTGDTKSEEKVTLTTVSANDSCVTVNTSGSVTANNTTATSKTVTITGSYTYNGTKKDDSIELTVGPNNSNWSGSIGFDFN